MILSVSLLLAVAGCDSGDGRLEVSGTVTLDGEPLPSGSISFRPMQGTHGPTGGGEIVDGRFSIRSDKGVMPGSYRVEISATRKTGKKVMDTILQTEVDEIVQYLPDKYNKDSELVRELTEAGPNELTFELTSQ